MAHEEIQLSSREIFNGKVIRLTEDIVRTEAGSEAKREVVHHNGGAAIVALDGKGRVALVRQFRYAAGRELVELPAGKVEAGEAPRSTAVRELEEEVGYVADHWHDFGSIIPTCAYDTEVIYLYFATGLRETAQHLDEDEFLSVFWMDLDDAVAQVLSNEITDGKTVAGLLRAKLLKDSGKLPV